MNRIPFMMLLMVGLAGGVLNGVVAQTPDWLFVLEGAYVGRYETPISNGDMMIQDARWDGKRNGKEDGFVLQISRESDAAVLKEAQVWTWDSQESVLNLMVLEDGVRKESQWFCETSGPATILTRGGNISQRAAIIRIRMERLPGQLRVQEHANFGDGEWILQWRYVLDDFMGED